jgi:hypothetical protein
MILPGGTQGQPQRVLAPLVLAQGQGDRVEERCGAPRAGRLGLAERGVSPQTAAPLSISTHQAARYAWASFFVLNVLVRWRRLFVTGSLPRSTTTS